MQEIDRTDQGGTRPSLFHLSAHSDKSRAHALDCHCAERWNNDGRVPPRFVLYLLYIKHDQMIFEPNISISKPYIAESESFITILSFL